MSRAIDYLLSSLIQSETDSLAINTIFDAVAIDDVPAEYRELYAILRQVWAIYAVLEPVAIVEQIKLIHRDEGTQRRLTNQYVELSDVLMGNTLWQHYLKLLLIDIKVAKTNSLGRTLTVPDPKLVDEVLTQTQQTITDIMSRYQLQKKRSLDNIITDYATAIESVATHGQPNAIHTGYGWEKYIKGFRPGDYILLAARPKMGKSAVANAVVVRALRQDKRVMLVNNEMDEMSVMNRLVANIGKVNCDMLQSPDWLKDEQLKSVMTAMDYLRQTKLNLYCMTMKTPRDIETEAVRLRECGQAPDLIVIDYLQLLQASDPDRRKSRYDEVSYLSWEMKMLANNLRVPVLVLSQLNRQLEQRINKRPNPADLRDSGSLEQDATAVMFLYRDEVYNPDTYDVGIGEINVSINRNGKSGVTYYALDFDHMDILDTEREAAQ